MGDRMTGTPPTEERTPESTRSRPVFRPLADIFEDANALVAILELPGVTAEGLSVTVDQRVMTIRARPMALVPSGLALISAEYRVGDFERSFTLAETVDTDRIEAVLKDGILRLTLPKTVPAPARTIKVTAG